MVGQIKFVQHPLSRSSFGRHHSPHISGQQRSSRQQDRPTCHPDPHPWQKAFEGACQGPNLNPGKPLEAFADGTEARGQCGAQGSLHLQGGCVRDHEPVRPPGGPHAGAHQCGHHQQRADTPLRGHGCQCRMYPPPPALLFFTLDSCISKSSSHLHLWICWLAVLCLWYGQC